MYAQSAGDREFFYRPKEATAGDFIPFFHDGKLHLFYMHAWRDKASHGPGVPWHLITTKDFMHFIDHGEAIPCRSASEQDRSIATGSVIEAGGEFHAFYAGNNQGFRQPGR